MNKKRKQSDKIEKVMEHDKKQNILETLWTSVFGSKNKIDSKDLMKYKLFGNQVHYKSKITEFNNIMLLNVHYLYFNWPSTDKYNKDLAADFCNIKDHDAYLQHKMVTSLKFNNAKLVLRVVHCHCSLFKGQEDPENIMNVIMTHNNTLKFNCRCLLNKNGNKAYGKTKQQQFLYIKQTKVTVPHYVNALCSDGFTFDNFALFCEEHDIRPFDLPFKYQVEIYKLIINRIVTGKASNYDVNDKKIGLSHKFKEYLLLFYKYRNIKLVDDLFDIKKYLNDCFSINDRRKRIELEDTYLYKYALEFNQKSK